MPQPLIFDELCSLCRSIFSDPRASPNSVAETNFRYHSMRQLKDTANAGCHFCSMIVGNLDDDIVSELRDRYHLRSGHRNGHALTLHVGPALRKTPGLWVRLFCEAIQGHEAYPDRTKTCLLRRSGALVMTSSSEVVHSSVFARSSSRHLLSAESILGKSDFPSTMNEDAINSIRRWISYCEKAHPGCTRKMKSTGSKLPGRLLDVKCHMREGNGIRIVKTDNLPSTTRYVTLSHRWSQHKQTQLLGQNEAMFHEHILISKLSKTFKDAIELTRTLGIEYLWIDSLCIIQDSGNDRIEQIMLMSEIYANCSLNVAAVSASEGTEGLDHRRNSLAIFPCIAGNSAEDESTICYDDNAWQEFVATSVLNSRGWVIQERLLAPRTVSFAVDQVYWECGCLRASESFPFGLPHQGSDPDWGGTNMKELLVPRKKDQIGADIDVRQFMENWGLILRMYTGSTLTYESDRLRALSGVTNRLALNYGIPEDSDYIAGFWRFGLEYQLLWYPELETGAPRDPESIPPCSWTSHGVLKLSHAPSWSWVSYDGWLGLQIFRSNDLSLVSILSLGCDDVDCNSFCLRVQGYICNVSSSLTDKEAVLTTSSARSSEEGTHLLDQKHQVSDSEILKAAKLEFILLFQRPRDLTEEDSGIACLLLELTGRKRGQYRRIGKAFIGQDDGNYHFSYDHPGKDHLELNHYIKHSRYRVLTASTLARQVESVELPEACFESFQKGKGYIIEII